MGSDFFDVKFLALPVSYAVDYSEQGVSNSILSISFPFTTQSTHSVSPMITKRIGTNFCYRLSNNCLQISVLAVKTTSRTGFSFYFPIGGWNHLTLSPSSCEVAASNSGLPLAQALMPNLLLPDLIRPSRQCRSYELPIPAGHRPFPAQNAHVPIV